MTGIFFRFALFFKNGGKRKSLHHLLLSFSNSLIPSFYTIPLSAGLRTVGVLFIHVCFVSRPTSPQTPERPSNETEGAASAKKGIPTSRALESAIVHALRLRLFPHP